MRPTIEIINGMQRNWLMRLRTSRSNRPKASAPAMIEKPSTPEGASVVNRTSVISPNAVSNPVVII